jgi:hypothetical protein
MLLIAMVLAGAFGHIRLCSQALEKLARPRGVEPLTPRSVVVCAHIAAVRSSATGCAKAHSIQYVN